MTNQRNGLTTSESLQYVELEAREAEKFRVRDGDIIFNRTNSFELVGKTSIFRLEGHYVFASYLIRLRTIKNRLLPDFLNLFFNHEATQKRLKLIATRGVSQSNT